MWTPNSPSTHFHWAQVCQGTWCQPRGHGWSPWRGNPGLPWPCGDTAGGWYTPPSPGHPVQGKGQRTWAVLCCKESLRTSKTDSLGHKLSQWSWPSSDLRNTKIKINPPPQNLAMKWLDGGEGCVFTSTTKKEWLWVFKQRWQPATNEATEKCLVRTILSDTNVGVFFVLFLNLPTPPGNCTALCHAGLAAPAHAPCKIAPTGLLQFWHSSNRLIHLCHF